MTTATVANTDKISGALAETSEIRAGMTLQALMKTKTVKDRFEEVLGKKAAGFMSSVVTAYSLNDGLKKCEPMSVISSAAIAAALDLPINSNLGFAHIVPYKGVATFQMGYKGFIQLAQRSGQYLTLNVCEVYEGEMVKSNRFSGLMEFDESKKTSNKIVGYVSYFKLLNGFEKWLYISAENMEKHAKQYSQSYKNGQGRWVDKFVDMAKKTCVKQILSKWGILSIEMQKAIEFDQAAVTKDNQPQYVDGSDAIEAETIGSITNTEDAGDTLPKEVLLKSGEYEVEQSGKTVKINSGGKVYTSDHEDIVKAVLAGGKKSQNLSLLFWAGKEIQQIESVKVI